MSVDWRTGGNPTLPGYGWAFDGDYVFPSFWNGADWIDIGNHPVKVSAWARMALPEPPPAIGPGWIPRSQQSPRFDRIVWLLNAQKDPPMIWLGSTDRYFCTHWREAVAPGLED